MRGEFTAVPVFYGNGKELLFDPDYSISISIIQSRESSIPSVNEPPFLGDFSGAAGFLRHFFLKKVAFQF
jgi:hypothetical protein